MQEKEQNPAASHALTLRGGRTVNPWLALIALLFGFFMSLLDATIMNIAIPNIQEKLNTDLTSVTWTLNSYSLVFAVLLVTMGRFADQFGRKAVFMIGMVIFSVGSLLCALSGVFGDLTGWPAINWLITFRAVQGIGAAALNSVSLAIITAIFPIEKRGAAMGVWGASSGLAAALGPMLGGFLIENFDWRWIFFVNLPFCLVGIVMVFFFVPETRDPRGSKHIDFLGVLTLSGTIFCSVLAIMEGNEWGWGSLPVIGLFVGAGVAFVLFVIVELLQKEPIVDFRLFKRISFTIPNLIMILFGLAMQGGVLILVLYLISVRHTDELGAAYALLPMPLASFVVSAIIGRIRTQPKYLAMIGTILMTISLLGFALLDPDAAYWDLLWRAILFGVGMGMIFQSLPALVLSDVPRAKYGMGSGIFSTFRQIGFVVGTSILISIFTGQLPTNMEQAKQNSIAIVQEDTNLPAQARQQIVQGLEHISVSSGNSRSASSQKVDLTQYANMIPEQYRAAALPELRSLSERIENEFATNVAKSYSASWYVAAGAAFLAVILAFFLPKLRRGAAGGTTPEGDQVAELIGSH